MRGKPNAFTKKQGLNLGSPPRMRGKLLSAPDVAKGKGITPAHAGKTYAVSMYNLSALGSPPRMRGKPATKARRAVVSRITPAHAGKTKVIIDLSQFAEDHPRACGENPYVAGIVTCEAGSPPRMRGKLAFCTLIVGAGGITPAHAGKTDIHRPDRAVKRGSPPRMRGKQPPRLRPCAAQRITPAHAGKTILCRRVTVGYEDHPRACGENICQVTTTEDVSGSPPRMRGKLLSGTPRKQLHGITPAHAGKTPSCTTFAPLVQDHPRACGENCRHDERTGASRRITPAHAGKTVFGTDRRTAAEDHPRACGENQFRFA